MSRPTGDALRRLRSSAVALSLLLVGLATPAHAYIGPGAGFELRQGVDGRCTHSLRFMMERSDKGGYHHPDVGSAGWMALTVRMSRSLQASPGSVEAWFGRQLT